MYKSPVRVRPLCNLPARGEADYCGQQVARLLLKAIARFTAITSLDFATVKRVGHTL